jgi:hypothetical protein
MMLAQRYTDASSVAENSWAFMGAGSVAPPCLGLDGRLVSSVTEKLACWVSSVLCTRRPMMPCGCTYPISHNSDPAAAQLTED